MAKLDVVDVTEQKRLNDAREAGVPWKKWGPYLSERQWGTVREDYSDEGNAWSYDADVEGRFTYLAQLRPRRLAKGRFAVVHGVLERGGVTVGLQREDAWAAAVNITGTTAR